MNYTSCFGGICSTAPAIELRNAISATGSATSIGNVDDAMFNVNLPFNITLYTTTTDLVTVTSNGVSICLIETKVSKSIMHMKVKQNF